MDQVMPPLLTDVRRTWPSQRALEPATPATLEAMLTVVGNQLADRHVMVLDTA